jgi:hypothetical protein
MAVNPFSAKKEHILSHSLAHLFVILCCYAYPIHSLHEREQLPKKHEKRRKEEEDKSSPEKEKVVNERKEQKRAKKGRMRNSELAKEEGEKRSCRGVGLSRENGRG